MTDTSDKALALAATATSDTLPEFIATIDLWPQKDAVRAMTLAVRRDTMLARTAAFREWVAANAGFILRETGYIDALIDEANAMGFTAGWGLPRNPVATALSNTKE